LVNYDTEELIELTNNINNNLGASLGSDTIISYLTDYNSKCSDYKVMPVDIQLEMLEERVTVVVKEKTFWEKYRYELIFLSIIVFGIIIFESIKRKSGKKELLRRIPIPKK